jgi:hypothetical protein
MLGIDMFYRRAPVDRKTIDEMLALGATASLDLAADAAGRQRRLGAAGIGMRRAGHAYIVFAGRRRRRAGHRETRLTEGGDRGPRVHHRIQQESP